MMRLLVLLFFTITYSYSQETFKGHEGRYVYGQAYLEQYFLINGIDYFDFVVPFSEKYKLNRDGRLEIENWYSLEWMGLQRNFTFDRTAYQKKYNGKTFNEAKKNYYKNLVFNTEIRKHVEDISFFKEWGILNHPPFFNEIREDLSSFSKYFKPIDLKNVETPLFTKDFHVKLDELTDTELTFDNELKLLMDNKSFKRKLELITNAKKTIFMSSLVFTCDESSEELAEALVQKAKAGVDVFVLVDKAISFYLYLDVCLRKGGNFVLNMMKDSPVKLIKANPIKNPLKDRVIYHSKKLVVDFEQAIVGGHNVINADNLSSGTDFKNRDADLYIKGALVTDIAAGFLSDYNHFFQARKKLVDRGNNYSDKFREKYNEEEKLINGYFKKIEAIKDKERGNKLRGLQLYEPFLSDVTLRTQGVCRFVQQSPNQGEPLDKVYVIGRAFLHYLDHTKNYLGMMNQLMADTDYIQDKKEKYDRFDMFKKLRSKILGLASDNESFHIDLITSGPEIIGNEFTVIQHERIKAALKKNDIKEANKGLKKADKLNRNVGVRHYQNILTDYVPHENIDVWTHVSFNHSKVFYFDRYAVSIGSYNLHHNATDHAYENTIFCQDEQLNKEIDRIFVEDMANSVPLKFSRLEGEHY